MSGYLNADSDAEHALILAENALHAVRNQMYTRVDSATECTDCGDTIPEARRKALPGVFQCVSCRTAYESTHHPQKIKMLDRIL